VSTQIEPETDERLGAPEFTDLGKRLEILRIERRFSKQHLARHAATSRQQLWRVMTGKSELTNSLRDRLATALAIEPEVLSAAYQPVGYLAPDSSHAASATLTVTEYLGDTVHLARTLRTLPACDGGRRLKRALIHALEDLTVEAGRALPAEYSDLHRRVLAGEL
jgi:transcriptional regulator with XRE-family HTH domain